MKSFLIQSKILEKKIKIFRVRDLEKLLDISYTAATKIAERYTKKGVFVRLKRGFYTPSFNFPSPYFLANKVYQPSYVSFETALSFHHIIPERVYGVTSATTKNTREFEIKDISLEYFKIKIQAYTGYSPMKQGDEIILMAEKEKALADFLYFVNLGKRRLPDRLNLREIDGKKLFSFIEMFARPRMMKLAKGVLKRK